MSAQPRFAEELELLFPEGWPGVVPPGQEVKQLVEHAHVYFSSLEIALLHDELLVGSASAVPIRWNGEPSDLPRGYTDTLSRAVVDFGSGIEPDTMAIMTTHVRPDMRGRGLIAELLIGLRELADELGFDQVIAPVRPASKALYPLTPIETFSAWTEPDGAPLDQLVRTHWRLGARIIATSPESISMTATVSEWETWTKLDLLSSGDYIIPDGLSILSVDMNQDCGTYIEPSIWMHHR
ncbi:MAG TPA: hypothetical protein VMV52_02345 [Candidatus Nanopelagicaceae bacterium]|nr:hypothetical protein [Candidatus Nanopelagicaceae bacterium]